MKIDMKKVIIQLSEMRLLGISARTNNTAEMTPESAQIPITMEKFFSKNLLQIPNRKNPGTIYCVYTNYENDFNGEYTYFIAEEVTSFDGESRDFEPLTIPAQTYTKFTSVSGKMPKLVNDMWQNIWKMKSSDLGGERAYIADFELYDNRSIEPENTVVDVYVGIKNS